MPAKKRIHTKYPGVHFIYGLSASGKKERIYYIRYRKNGKLIEEKCGRQFKDDMTPARAAQVRTRRIEGDKPSNEEKRQAERAKNESEASRWTIERLWVAYKENKPNLKGIVTDENRFQNYIQPHFGAKEPSELLPLDVDRLRLKLLKTKAPGTVRNVLELLRRVSNFGVKKNLCKGITFTIEMPKTNSLKTEDLTPEQLSSLLDAIDQDTNIHAGNMMKLALFSGMRRGEMFRLKWEDIDFENGFIHLRNPKGGTDEVIPLSQEARNIFKSHPRSKSQFVFPGRKGRQRTDIKHQVNRIKDRAGIPKSFRALHGLRHVFASMLASSGKVDLYTLQKLLTHKSPTMTMRYAHLRDEALKRASNVAGEIIGQAVRKKDNVIQINEKS